MTKQDPWFYEERAFAFASLALTEVKDVAIRTRPGTDLSLDILVELLRKGQSTLRFFGVQLKPYLDLPEPDKVDHDPGLPADWDPLEAAFPVCLFVIGVREPNGIYRWLAEPVIRDGHAELQAGATNSWHRIDKTEITRLIRQVRDWYDARGGTSKQPRSSR
jgi:hypothetical protein